MKEISMDAKYIELIESGRKVRTARMSPKANIGDVVSIFNKPYLITERRIMQYPYLVDLTYREEGFGSREQFEAELRRIYGDAVYKANLYSHKFRAYDGEVIKERDGNNKVLAYNGVYCIVKNGVLATVYLEKMYHERCTVIEKNWEDNGGE